MGNDFKDWVEDFCSGLKKQAQEKASKVADRIANEQESTAKLAIASFYSNYKPTKYKRHYTNFMNNAHKRYYNNARSTTYYGGVEQTPDAMESIYHANYKKGNPSVDPQYIYWNTMAGRHGAVEFFPPNVRNNITNVPPVMSPSPIEMILMKREEIINNIDSYID